MCRHLIRNGFFFAISAAVLQGCSGPDHVVLRNQSAETVTIEAYHDVFDVVRDTDSSGRPRTYSRGPARGKRWDEVGTVAGAGEQEFTVGYRDLGEYAKIRVLVGKRRPQPISVVRRNLPSVGCNGSRRATIVVDMSGVARLES